MTAGPSSAGELLDAVRGVTWESRRPAKGAASGAHRSTVRGSTAEFAEYRLYRQGDDPRRIDWRVLARSDRAYIRLATERAVLPTTLVVDASASMAFPEPGLDKWILAREIAVALAAIAHGSGDPIGLTVACGETVARVAPLSRRGVVAQIAGVANGVSPSGGAPLGPLVLAARTARVAIITDLLGDAEEILRAAKLVVARGGEAHLVHMVAVDELHPARGARTVRDPEDASIERVLNDAALRQYEANFDSWLRGTARAWRSAGANYTLVLTDESAAHAARRVVAAKSGPGS